MADIPEDMAAEPTMDAASLYREEIYTDRKVGTIRVLTPVLANGLADPGRAVGYVGEAQLLTTVGALPLSFEIEAASLGEAAERFGTGAKVAVERAMQELQEMRREAASSIVIPGRDQLGFGRAGPGPGGGKIQFP